MVGTVPAPPVRGSPPAPRSSRSICSPAPRENLCSSRAFPVPSAAPWDSRAPLPSLPPGSSSSRTERPAHLRSRRGSAGAAPHPPPHPPCAAAPRPATHRPGTKLGVRRDIINLPFSLNSLKIKLKGFDAVTVTEMILRISGRVSIFLLWFLALE